MVDLIVHRDSEGSDPKIDKEAGQIVMGKKFPSMYVCLKGHLCLMRVRFLGLCKALPNNALITITPEQLPNGGQHIARLATSQS